VVELGSALRDARERSGLALADVERETHIRARYLDALERERFERVPERAYARAFLLEYAELLGLESGPLVAEFDSRFPPEPAPRLVVVEPSRRPLVLVVVAVGILALAIGMLARAHKPLPRPLALTPPREPRSTAHAVVHKVAPRPQHSSGGLVLVAHGPCWVEAHAGGTRLGQRVLYRTLRPGERIRLNGARFWLRLGAPRNLEARVGGRLVRLPLKTSNVVVATRAS
jgi:transcriptional regulator with XRE-family HTH domain